MRITRIVTAALIMSALALPGAVEASCHGNVPPCVSGVQDRQLVLLGNSFVPDEVTVSQPGRLFLQNFDSVPHTVTHVGCTDGDSGTPCRFDKSAPANYNLMRAQIIFTGPGYVPPGTYPFYCTIHGGPPEAPGADPTGMAGLLRVL